MKYDAADLEKRAYALSNLAVHTTQLLADVKPEGVVVIKDLLIKSWCGLFLWNRIWDLDSNLTSLLYQLRSPC